MSNGQGYEIDFLPVGNGDRSGDAIAMRYGTPNNYKVIVYDGGTKESGKALVDHIRTHYGTNHVDYVINSHPDTDHASGLSVVLEQLDVGELWMHQPWNYSSIIRDYFHDGRITDNSLAERLQSKMAAAYNLEKLAEEKGIPVHAPFQGEKIGCFTVLSPEKDWYIHDLVADFQKSPTKKKSESAIVEALLKSWNKTAQWISERWDIESLREDVTTSAENESSVILFAQIDGKGILLTGDAGVHALSGAIQNAEARNILLPDTLNFIQVPHHGSRHNVSTSVLDRIVGKRKATNDSQITKTAFVSAGKTSSTHPRPSVINAFIRRGARVVQTKGSTICHYHNMPSRTGWKSAEVMTFSEQVESWD